MRKGFVLPATLLLISVVLLFAVTRHYFSRNQLIRSAHYANYEKAYHLAMGGLDSSDKLLARAFAFYNDQRPSSLPKIDKAPAELAAIVKGLVDDDGIPFPRNEMIPIKLNSHELLQRSWEKFAELNVNLEIKDLGPLLSNSSDSGPVADPREKRVLLLLHAEAKVNGAVARVCRYREARIINILPSVLGKFVLFLRGQGALNVNSIEDSLTDRSRVSDAPLVIHSGKSTEFASIEPQNMSDFFDKQGWVFLGGDAPWVIGSGAGGGGADIKSAFIKEEKHHFPIPSTDKFSEQAYLAYYSQPEFLAKDLKQAAYNNVLQELNDEMLLSSRLRMSGSKALPTPTNTVGKVVHRWALTQGLKNTDSGIFTTFPFISETMFSTSTWPGLSQAAVNIVRDNFSGSYAAYKARMSRIIEESYNAINLRAVNFTDAPLDQAIMIDPRQITPDVKLMPLSKRLVIDATPASFVEANYGSSYEINADDGRKLFVGDLDGFDDMACFSGKAAINCEDSAEFFKHIQTGADEWVLANSYLVKGDLTIDRPVNTQRGCGGLVFVEGNILITDEITAPENEPITFVSLNGNIRLATSRPIQAGLIALRGSVAADSAIDITGVIAARELSMARLLPHRTRKITYNHSFDSTDTLTYNRGFRIFTTKEGTTFVR